LRFRSLDLPRQPDFFCAMTQRHCPVCERLFDPEESRTLPFCSVRCRLADLNRWFNEGYSLPYERPEEDESGPIPRDEPND